jgi:hypothetical protein
VFENKLGYSVALSEKVEELLRDGALDEIFKIVQADIDEEWKRTPPGDSQLRETLYHESHALNRLQLKLSAVVQGLSIQRRGEWQ